MNIKDISPPTGTFTHQGGSRYCSGRSCYQTTVVMWSNTDCHTVTVLNKDVLTS